MSSPPSPEAGRTVGPSGVPVLLGVEEGYKRWAPSYDRALNPVVAREERYVESLFLNVRGKKVLDLACGTGRWLERLLGGGARCGAGVDVSSAMLRIADTKSSVRGKLVRSDCLDLPFTSSVFDFGICSFAIGHIRDLPRMGREFARVMEPGGEVLVSDLHPEAYARGWRTGFRDDHSAVQIEARGRVPEEIVGVFQAEGFECLAQVSLCLGEAERHIFIRAKKEEMFDQISRVPAVLFCRFRRR